MIVYFNNCQGREHAMMYGSGAFYDLGTVGFQANKANNLKVGQECIVAEPTRDNQIAFRWFSFSHETVMLDNADNPCRVFFGKFIKLDTRPKLDAARDGIYSPFFDKNGNFKRQSVIQR